MRWFLPGFVMFLTLAGCSPRAAAPASEVSVVYEKTGGFMPFNDRFVVRGDGSLAYTDRKKSTRTGKVAPADLQHLRLLLASREFQDAVAEYRAKGGADLVTHRIEATIDGRTKTVLWETGAPAPAVVEQVIAELEKLALRVE